MKIFFWLLVVVNVVFFAVMKSGILDNTQNTQTLTPLHEERISLMKKRIRPHGQLHPPHRPFPHQRCPLLHPLQRL